MVIFAQLFISISISFQKHSFKQYFQSLEPENPRTKIKKCCQKEQLKFINTIHNCSWIYGIIFSWLNWLPPFGLVVTRNFFSTATNKKNVLKKVQFSLVVGP